MKKTFLTIAITLGLAFGAMAQSDGFFSDWNMGGERGIDNPEVPALPDGGMTGNQDAPVGGGLLILTALGAGYAFLKKNEEK